MFIQKTIEGLNNVTDYYTSLSETYSCKGSTTQQMVRWLQFKWLQNKLTPWVVFPHSWNYCNLSLPCWFYIMEYSLAGLSTCPPNHTTYSHHSNIFHSLRRLELPVSVNAFPLVVAHSFFFSEHSSIIHVFYFFTCPFMLSTLSNLHFALKLPYSRH